MGELIFLIIIINFIVKAIKKSKEEQKKNNTQTKVTYQMPKKNVRTSPVYEQLDMQSIMKSEETAPWEKAARENIEKAKKRATAKLHEADKEDVTLNTMEAEHNHSERIAPAIHYHSEDVIPENTLGSVEDLIVKGYDGSLCFERDFVGEAMDMISRFTVPSDVPNFNKDGEVA